MFLTFYAIELSYYFSGVGIKILSFSIFTIEPHCQIIKELFQIYFQEKTVFIIHLPHVLTAVKLLKQNEWDPASPLGRIPSWWCLDSIRDFK